MKRDLVQLVIALFVLAFGGAAEELAPKFLGAGVPVLLSATAYFAVRRTPLAGILFAVAAGSAEDALSGLPFLLSVSYFAVVAGLLRGFKLSVWFALPAFCGYQIWLWMWLGGALNGSVFSRLFAALPLGGITLVVTDFILRGLDRKAAVNEK